jgi:hypothetical protein
VPHRITGTTPSFSWVAMTKVPRRKGRKPYGYNRQGEWALGGVTAHLIPTANRCALARKPIFLHYPARMADGRDPNRYWLFESPAMEWLTGADFRNGMIRCFA